MCIAKSHVVVAQNQRLVQPGPRQVRSLFNGNYQTTVNVIRVTIP